MIPTAPIHTKKSSYLLCFTKAAFFAGKAMHFKAFMSSAHSGVKNFRIQPQLGETRRWGRWDSSLGATFFICDLKQGLAPLTFRLVLCKGGDTQSLGNNALLLPHTFNHHILHQHFLSLCQARPPRLRETSAPWISVERNELVATTARWPFRGSTPLCGSGPRIPSEKHRQQQMQRLSWEWGVAKALRGDWSILDNTACAPQTLLPAHSCCLDCWWK